MTRIVAFENLTLDGVMQAPGRPDEDRRGGFTHGGWAVPYADQAIGKAAQESMGSTGGLLLGRRTYGDFHGFWPKQTDNPFTEILDNSLKYVASTTLREPLPWTNSKLLAGDAAKAVAKLRKGRGKDLVILGSGKLVQALMADDLIDEFILLIHPLVLGSGHRLFRDDGTMASLRLVDSTTTKTGVMIATYRPAAHVKG
ncbi:MAG TPA: dihydrofolate reductase family protein [Candidatus Limnocylindrales bacterium]